MYTHTAEIANSFPKSCGMAKQRIGSPLGTILLVEDEAFVREVTSEVLQDAGYRVLGAGNAAEALQVYERHCGVVDLLLTDVVLPGESGRTLAHRLQQRNPALQVLLVTGYGEQITQDHANEAECLPKPFSSAALLQRIRQMLHELN